MKHYKDDVTLEAILIDGWARGFHSSQTAEEAVEMGFEITETQVVEAWAKIEDDYENNILIFGLSVKEVS